MNNNIKAVLFDMDGVLVDEGIHTRCWEKVAKIYNLFYNKEKAIRQAGVSNKASIAIMLEQAPREFNEQEKVEIRKLKDSLYAEAISKLTYKDRLEGSKELLDFLKLNNIRTALVTSSRYTSTILPRLGFENYFDPLIDAYGITNFKPHPEIYLKASKILNIKPENCLIIDDSAPSLVNAKKEGFLIAGISSSKDLKEADYHLNSLLDLIEIFENDRMK